MTQHGEFNWNELQTSDATIAVEFYNSSIGWTFQAEQMPPGGTYWIGLADQKPVCGVLTVEHSEKKPFDRWITYVHVNDLDAAIDKCQRRLKIAQLWRLKIAHFAMVDG